MCTTRSSPPTQSRPPCKFTYKQQGDFIIARNPAPKVTPLALPADVQRVMESGVAWERCGAIAFLEGWLQSDDRGKAAAARTALTKLAADDSRQVSTTATEALSRAPADPQVERNVQVDSRRQQPPVIPTPTATPVPTPARVPTPAPVPTPTPVPAAQPRSGKAVAALVCSILGITFVSVPLVAWGLGGIGFFLGRNAIKQIDAGRGAVKGKTMATWAWALGLVAIGFGFIVFLYLASTSRYISPYQ